MSIEFYGHRNPHGHFSNFSPHAFVLDGATWTTVEHYFQAQKFAGTPREEAIRLARDPMAAKRMGRSRKYALRPDWEQVKEDVMRRALHAKFTQHEGLRTALLATGEELLVEASPTDGYWGAGRDGRGRNRLGVLLVELRSRLRAADQSS